MSLIRDLLPWWPVLSFLLNAAAAGTVFIGALMMKNVARREVQTVTDPMIAKSVVLETRVTVVESRIDEAEDDIKNLPTKEDIARVEGKVTGVDARVAAVGDGVRRLEGYFLERGVHGVEHR